MGNSTISVQDIIDTIAVRGSVNPQANPSGYSLTTCLAIANDVMNDLIAVRFNFKWNSALIPAFFTSPLQQDYPQLGLSTIGWLEGAWAVDFNSSTRPKPYATLEVDRDLDVTSQLQQGWPEQISWMYNRQLQTFLWPGAGQIYTNPQGVSIPPANGPMALHDANNNILVLTTFGTTGSIAPVAPAASAEGFTIADGTCVWTVCSPDGQGFRLANLPASGSPTWHLHVKYQQQAPKFTALTQLINPVPDDFAHQFRRGFNAMSHDYSADPKAQSLFPALRQAWQQGLLETAAQASREPDAYMLVPATSVVSSGFGIRRDPRNPGTPF